jgi:hypothetical protein
MAIPDGWVTDVGRAPILVGQHRGFLRSVERYCPNAAQSTTLGK